MTATPLTINTYDLANLPPGVRLFTRADTAYTFVQSKKVDIALLDVHANLKSLNKDEARYARSWLFWHGKFWSAATFDTNAANPTFNMLQAAMRIQIPGSRRAADAANKSKVRDECIMHMDSNRVITGILRRCLGTWFMDCEQSYNDYQFNDTPRAVINPDANDDIAKGTRAINGVPPLIGVIFAGYRVVHGTPGATIGGRPVEGLKVGDRDRVSIFYWFKHQMARKPSRG